jgi:hypothetical protein
MKTATLNIKIGLLLLWGALYILTYFLVLPYAQRTANSHMNIGPFLGTIYYIFSLAALQFSIRAIMRKDVTLFLLFVGAMTMFIYWGYRLHSLYCLGCANSG